MNYYGGYGGNPMGNPIPYGTPWTPVAPPFADPNVEEEEDDDEEEGGKGKKGNVLPLWGNEKSMNLNHLILTNIQGSLYFKSNLYELKTYHEVVDEIYYKVAHLEPWEKGSRRTAGQTGMCGGVRGVGSGGIVSSCFCILYKLFTLKLTRKQLNGLINHRDSPYIRALGFMYIRYCQPPADVWDWYEPYLNDEEELDVKAGGGNVMCVGEMLRQFLTKLDWYAALFPRIPVPIQKQLEVKMKEFGPFRRSSYEEEENDGGRHGNDDERHDAPSDVARAQKDASPSQRGESSRGDSHRRSSRDADDHRRRHRSRSRDHRRSRSRGRRSRDRSRERRRSRSSDRRSHKHHRRHGDGFAEELSRERDRQRRDHRERRSRDRSGDRGRRNGSRDRGGRRSRDRSRERRDRR